MLDTFVMSVPIIDDFCLRVLSDHSTASELKLAVSHQDIVEIAHNHNFSFPLQDWIRFLATDWVAMSDSQLLLAWDSQPTHWAWAFRQYSRWQELLMAGSSSEGLLRTSINSLTPSTLDIVPLPADSLDRFIEFVKQNASLMIAVKSCQSQEEVITLAEANGFLITPDMILLKWNTVTDFSSPTWYGWFS